MDAINNNSHRIMVERALAKAENYEQLAASEIDPIKKKTYQSEAERFLKLAEQADEVYNKIEAGKKDILKNAEES